MAELPPVNQYADDGPSSAGSSVTVRLKYDFYPPRYIQRAFPQLDVNDRALKGLLTNMTYLPHADVWYADAAIAPVKVHPAVLALVSTKQGFGVRTPEQCSHGLLAVFSTADFDSGVSESIQTVDGMRPGATEERRQWTLGVAAALGRCVAGASLDAVERYISGDFDGDGIIRRQVSNGMTELPPDAHRIVTTYTYAAD